MSKSVLVIDDNLTICLMLKSWLVKKGFNVDMATGVDQAKQMIKEQPFDLILSDIRMPGADGFALLSWVKKYDSDMVVIMMTGYADIESAVESMKSGAADYISKPIEPELLFNKIDEAFITQENIQKNNRWSNDFIKPPGQCYKELFRHLDHISENDTHRLIIGDRGTGKSSAVKYIYEKGIRHSKPLVMFDAGHSEKKAPGSNGKETTDSPLMEQFRAAKGGLFYLRELDQLDIHRQSELLSMLTRQPRDDDFTQVIVTSEKRKPELERILIPKLYLHLEEKAVTLPSLKGRKQEIAFFILHFLKFANHTLNKEVNRIDPALEEELLRHDWPGNIQELKNCIIKAVLMADGDRLTGDTLSSLFTKHTSPSSKKQDPLKAIHGLRKENYEKEKIQQALELAKGNKTMAASILNIDRKTLYNKIKLYNVALQ